MLKRAYRSLPKNVRSAMDRGFEAGLARMSLRQRIMLTYYKSYGHLPNLREPRLFSEKMQARKLSGEDFSAYIDKIRVKDFVRERCGDICIPTLYSGDDLPPHAERNWPLPYVIKTSHASGGNIFARVTPDWDTIEERLEDLLAYRHGHITGELFYLSIPPRVLVEPMIGGDVLPPDYKLWVVGGEVQFIHVDQDREHNHRRVFYSTSWDRLPISNEIPVGVDAQRPHCLARMVEIAETLGRDLGFVRVDLYEIEGRVYFGELTFTPAAGYGAFRPIELDTTLGAKWP